jgi:hypothetical protein
LGCRVKRNWSRAFVFEAERPFGAFIMINTAAQRAQDHNCGCAFNIAIVNGFDEIGFRLVFGGDNKDVVIAGIRTGVIINVVEG